MCLKHFSYYLGDYQFSSEQGAAVPVCNIMGKPGFDTQGKQALFQYSEDNFTFVSSEADWHLHKWSSVLNSNTIE